MVNEHTSDTTGLNRLKAFGIIAVTIAVVYTGLFCLAWRTAPNFFSATQEVLPGDPTTHSYTFPVVGSDASEYARLAESLAEQHTFSLYPQGAYLPETFRTPGYPLLLGIIKRVFHSWTPIVPIQILLVIFTAWLIWLLASQFISSRVALVPAFVYAADPATIFHSFLTLTDILFVFLIVAATALIVFNKKQQLSYWMIAGGVLGLSTLVRPIGLFTLIPFVITGFATILTGEKLRTGLKIVAMTSLGFSLVVLPWVARNRIVTDSFGLSSVNAYNLVTYTVPLFEAWRTGTAADLTKQWLYSRLGYGELGMRYLSHSAMLTAVATPFLTAHPVKYAEFHLSGLVPFFLSTSLKPVYLLIWDHSNASNPGILTTLRSHDVPAALQILKHYWLFIFEYLWWALVFMSATKGVWRSLLKERSAVSKDTLTISLFVLLIGYFAIATGPLATSRYRLPAEPFLLILASMAIWSKTNESFTTNE